ncbi:MAG: hypothetical protein NT003_01555 [Candidatus Magasanikbacteria bacterium]|nr:hypothetical protein [Candidatus Magasanikbacteria bacterium]
MMEQMPGQKKVESPDDLLQASIFNRYLAHGPTYAMKTILDDARKIKLNSESSDDFIDEVELLCGAITSLLDQNFSTLEQFRLKRFREQIKQELARIEMDAFKSLSGQDEKRIQAIIVHVEDDLINKNPHSTRAMFGIDYQQVTRDLLLPIGVTLGVGAALAAESQITEKPKLPPQLPAYVSVEIPQTPEEFEAEAAKIKVEQTEVFRKKIEAAAETRSVDFRDFFKEYEQIVEGLTATESAEAQKKFLENVQKISERIAGKEEKRALEIASEYARSPQTHEDNRNSLALSGQQLTDPDQMGNCESRTRLIYQYLQKVLPSILPHVKIILYDDHEALLYTDGTGKKYLVSPGWMTEMTEKDFARTKVLDPYDVFVEPFIHPEKQSTEGSASTNERNKHTNSKLTVNFPGLKKFRVDPPMPQKVSAEMALTGKMVDKAIWFRRYAGEYLEPRIHIDSPDFLKNLKNQPDEVTAARATDIILNSDIDWYHSPKESEAVLQALRTMHQVETLDITIEPPDPSNDLGNPDLDFSVQTKVLNIIKRWNPNEVLVNQLRTIVSDDFLDLLPRYKNLKTLGIIDFNIGKRGQPITIEQSKKFYNVIGKLGLEHLGLPIEMIMGENRDLFLEFIKSNPQIHGVEITVDFETGEQLAVVGDVALEVQKMHKNISFRIATQELAANLIPFFFHSINTLKQEYERGGGGSFSIREYPTGIFIDPFANLQKQTEQLRDYVDFLAHLPKDQKPEFGGTSAYVMFGRLPNAQEEAALKKDLALIKGLVNYPMIIPSHTKWDDRDFDRALGAVTKDIF